jgi:hypothetical protein
MDRLHKSPAIDAGSTSRRADLINEVALGFPDIESREPSIDPGISCHIDHKRINDRRNRGVSAKPVVPILPCRYPLRSRTASQNHRNTESSHPSPQHRLLCYMAPAFFANKPFAGVNVIAPHKSLLQTGSRWASAHTHAGRILLQEDGGGGMRREADQDLS